MTVTVSAVALWTVRRAHSGSPGDSPIVSGDAVSMIADRVQLLTDSVVSSVRSAATQLPS